MKNHLFFLQQQKNRLIVLFYCCKKYTQGLNKVYLVRLKKQQTPPILLEKKVGARLFLSNESTRLLLLYSVIGFTRLLLVYSLVVRLPTKKERVLKNGQVRLTIILSREGRIEKVLFLFTGTSVKTPKLLRFKLFFAFCHSPRAYPLKLFPYIRNTEHNGTRNTTHSPSSFFAYASHLSPVKKLPLIYRCFRCAPLRRRWDWDSRVSWLFLGLSASAGGY
eukprot:GEMP01059684.1.p1 GENE.GEMP01059684.1~~GEMP01059684.1.p1  ORF type:complete len:220 (-),score=-18.91 GEMP01059684.1:131-790(-)